MRVCTRSTRRGHPWKTSRVQGRGLLIIGTFLLVGERRPTFELLKCFIYSLSTSNCALYLFAVVVNNRYFPSSCIFLVGSKPEKYNALEKIS